MEPSLYEMSKQMSRVAAETTLKVWGLSRAENTSGAALTKHIQDCGTHLPGESENFFLADPMVEQRFPWESSGHADAEATGLFSQTFTNALKASGECYTPHAHQVRAWEALKATDACRSIVVTTGTGSGKTECYMYPLIDALARESKGAPLEGGIRALMIFPLNALSSDQQSRIGKVLDKMTTAEGTPLVTYAEYNGQTEEKDADVAVAENDRNISRIYSRDKIREIPPAILSTNTTMLEYMMVREQDRSILEKSQGKLKWIVLDETHTYTGSRATELAMLIRRVLIAFGVTADQVHFIATSATIGSDAGEAERKLKEFLSGLCGVSQENVSVITGRQVCPDIQLEEPSRELDLSASRQAVSAEAIRHSPLAIQLRDILIRDRRKTIRNLARDLFHTAEPTGEEIHKTYRLLDAASGVQDFLPIRVHFFSSELSGAYVCPDPNCTCQTPELAQLRQNGWKYGQIYFNKNLISCQCGATLFEMVRCGNCGQIGLQGKLTEARTGQDQYDRILPKKRTIRQSDDDLDRDDAELENTIPEEQALNEFAPKKFEFFVYPEGNISEIVRKNVSPGVQDPGREFHVELVKNGDYYHCPHCGKAVGSIEIPRVNSLDVSDDDYFQALSRECLDQLDPLNPGEQRQQRGRKLITFRDDRQGSARFTLRSSLVWDADYLTSLVLNNNPVKQIKDLFPNASEEVLAHLVAQAQTKEISFDSLPSGIDENLTAAWKIVYEPYVRAMEYKDNDEEIPQKIARTILYRMINRRNRKARAASPEGQGLLQIKYADVPDYNNLGEDFRELLGICFGIDGDAEWKALVGIAMELCFRNNGLEVFPLPPNNQGYILPDDNGNIAKSPRWTKKLYGQLLGFDVGFRRGSVAFPQNTSHRMRRYALELMLLRALEDPEDPRLREWLECSLDSDESMEAFRSKLLGNTASQASLDKLFVHLFMTLRDCGLLVYDTDLDREKARITPENGNQEHIDILGRLKLNLDKVRFTIPEYVWLSPEKDKFLTNAVKGLDPYLINLKNLNCIRVRAPKFSMNAEERAAIIDEQKSAGVWSRDKERIYEGNPLVITQEHTAQVNKQSLKTYVDRFKKGIVNVLNCSTTMEMGVDIGDVSFVGLANVPPVSANYFQRVGRGGRRGQGKAFALTSCEREPFSDKIFRDSEEIWRRNNVLPSISFVSLRKVRSHINAYLVYKYFLTHGKPMPNDFGTFFGYDRVDGEWTSFSKWLDHLMASAEAVEAEAGLSDELARLTKDTALQGQPVATILAFAQQDFTDINASFKSEMDMLNDYVGTITAVVDGEVKTVSLVNSFNERNNLTFESEAAMSAHWRAKKLYKEYFPKAMQGRCVFPAHGFPIDVMECIVHDMTKKQNESTYPRDTQPTRSRMQGIREYAPGKIVYCDKRRYQVKGVVFNWKIPVNELAEESLINKLKEAQQFIFHTKCNDCGHEEVSFEMPQTEQPCLHCQSKKISRKKVLVPKTMTIDWNDEITATCEEKEPRSYKISRLIGHHDAPTGDGASLAPENQSSLKDGSTVRFYEVLDAQNYGFVYLENSGFGKGFNICFRCGRATPNELEENHNALIHVGQRRPTTAEEKTCAEENHSKVKRFSLGAMIKTDVLQLNLPRTPALLIEYAAIIAEQNKYLPSDEQLKPDEAPEMAALTIAAAMRTQLALAFGIPEMDIGYGTIDKCSAALYDAESGGAGYMKKLFKTPGLIDDLLDKVHEVLTHCDCDRCCTECLVNYGTKYDQKKLNRQLGIALLEEYRRGKGIASN